MGTSHTKHTQKKLALYMLNLNFISPLIPSNYNAFNVTLNNIVEYSSAIDEITEIYNPTCGCPFYSVSEICVNNST